MAKSTRSKVKRAFRAKKRTQGVFAAADAARLQRLNAKLQAVTTTTTTTTLVDEGEKSEGDNGLERGGKEQDVDMPGSCWFAAFGLLDHQDIDPALMQSLGFRRPPHHMSSFTRSPLSTFSSIWC